MYYKQHFIVYSVYCTLYGLFIGHNAVSGEDVQIVLGNGYCFYLSGKHFQFGSITVQDIYNMPPILWVLIYSIIIMYKNICAN